MKNFIGHRVAILREKFQQSIGLPFTEILPQSQIEKALNLDLAQFNLDLAQCKAVL